MKKIALTMMSTLALGTSVFAATSGTLIIQGTVADQYALVITPNAATYQSLNIVAGSTATNVASVAETANNLNGYKIKLSSANGGELRHTSNAAKKTTYTLSYDGATAITPSSTATVVKSVTTLAGLTTNTSNVAVNVAAYASAPAGLYQDTLTISIEAN